MSVFFRSRLLCRKEVAQNTLAVRTERSPGFTFRAGQYVDLSVPGLEERDALGPVRSLSLASAPEADHLEFLMRVRDTAFKRALQTMPLGSELQVEGPFDDLHFVEDPSREMVFLAGGVGVAPFLSIVRDARAKGDDLHATLFYSNRRPEDAAFLDEIRCAEREISGFRLVATMTRPDEPAQGWTGEAEHVGLEMLARYLPAVVGPAYYVAGAPGFISHLRRSLMGAGVADADIGIEMYTGY